VALSLTDSFLAGLENYRELFNQLTEAKGAIKVFCKIAAEASDESHQSREYAMATN
jgi:hypothetical protein